jgi:hypothetical protein
VATKPNPASLAKAGAVNERLRREIDECRTMVKLVEDMLARYRRAFDRD